jgi:hypothetical protein
MCLVRVQVLTSTVAMVCICAANSQTKTPDLTGVKGSVMVSPIRPGPIKKGSDFPNAAPLPNATFSISNDTGTVTTFTTDATGRFEVMLRPGRYVVSLAENRFPKHCGPFEIAVEEGKMTEVEWRCDSGMR